jgi:hypothetical protein
MDTAPHPAPTPARHDDSIASILGMLAAVRRRTRIWIWAESLAIAAAVALAGAWLSLVLDRLVEPPIWVRAAMLAAVAAAVAWVLVTRLAMRLAVPPCTAMSARRPSSAMHCSSRSM